MNTPSVVTDSCSASIFHLILNGSLRKKKQPVASSNTRLRHLFSNVFLELIKSVVRTFIRMDVHLLSAGASERFDNNGGEEEKGVTGEESGEDGGGNYRVKE